MTIIGKLIVPKVVNAVNCADCPYFQWELSRSGEHVPNMVKYNVCPKREDGSCSLGISY